MSSCELNLGDQYVRMYVYEDSNFEGFHIPHVYANAQIWFDYKACLISSSILMTSCIVFFCKICYIERFSQRQSLTFAFEGMF